MNNPKPAKEQNTKPAATSIEVKISWVEPVDSYRLGIESEYIIEPPEFSTFGTRVWLRREYEPALLTQELEELTTYEIVGMEIIAPRRQGRLIEHPFWVYKVQPIEGGEVKEVEEAERILPHSIEEAAIV